MFEVKGGKYLLVRVDLTQVGVEWIWEASGDELCLCVVCQTLHVELSLEVLESESIVENGSITACWSSVVDNIWGVPLLDWGAKDKTGSSKES